MNARRIDLVVAALMALIGLLAADLIAWTQTLLLADSRSWPWATALAAAFHRLAAPPSRRPEPDTPTSQPPERPTDQQVGPPATTTQTTGPNEDQTGSSETNSERS